jgi:hypothetical protein
MSEGSDARLRTGQALLAILIIALFALIGFKYLPKSVDPEVSNIPKEIQLTYLPADFNFEMDEENALQILNNPKRYRREFDGMVRDLNMAILNHVANRMGLPQKVKNQLPDEYAKHHDYLRNIYYEEFLRVQDTSSNIYQVWYDNRFKNAAVVWYEVAAKYTCYLVNNVLGNFVPQKDGAFYAKGKKVDTPCGIALTEALAPLMKRMEERAAIEDFGRSRGILQERVEKMIAELATYEIRDKKGLSKQFQTKVWGFSVSSTDVEITAISIMKLGFRLDQYFNIDINSRSKLVTVNLPEPVVLSHEVYPRMEQMDIGWLREIRSEDLNKAFNVLRQEFRQDMMETDAMDQAKTKARDILNTMMGPLVASLGNKYKLSVKFQGREGLPDDYRPRGRFDQADDNSR